VRPKCKLRVQRVPNYWCDNPGLHPMRTEFKPYSSKTINLNFWDTIVTWYVTSKPRSRIHYLIIPLTNNIRADVDVQQGVYHYQHYHFFFSFQPDNILTILMCFIHDHSLLHSPNLWWSSLKQTKNKMHEKRNYNDCYCSSMKWLISFPSIAKKQLKEKQLYSKKKRKKSNSS
jgi:hypothetical protein